MELIEIGRNSFCLGISNKPVPRDSEKLRSFAEKTLSEHGFSLPDGAEITVFSNGVCTLLFVCGKTFSHHCCSYSFFS